MEIVQLLNVVLRVVTLNPSVYVLGLLSPVADNVSFNTSLDCINFRCIYFSKQRFPEDKINNTLLIQKYSDIVRRNHQTFLECF